MSLRAASRNLRATVDGSAQALLLKAARNCCCLQRRHDIPKGKRAYVVDVICRYIESPTSGPQGLAGRRW
ncbi:hypothetical protein ABT294_35950 [Nonomuraea sp. NPDC000554]|uniref:hypothetical protein n=1 Tax=Nonomuraea sp. NPDC000554 TaxID=3154259 RepID=UPI0033250AC4